jgi:DNA polymerase III subunit delta
VSVDELIRKVRAGEVPAVCVLTGSERVLVDRAVTALRAAAVGDGVPGFNEDLFQGPGLAARTVIQAARTVPMLSARRFVLVRSVDALAAPEQDALADYLKQPTPEACLVLVAEKLDGRAKLGRAAREAGVLWDAEPPKAYELPQVARREADALGHPLDDAAAQAIADAIGPDTSALADALERLSLYVGAGKPIREDDVVACVARVRTESVWALVDAVGAKNARVALASAASLLADREPPLRILALVARQLRTLARMRSALASGLRPQEAAQKAGAPPFKARDLAQLCARFPPAELSRAFAVVAQADLDLKGSKVPGPRVLEQALLSLCR